MALSKTTLAAAIESAFVKQNNKDSITIEDARKELADDLATAIYSFVKTGQVQVTVTGTSPSGAVTGTGTGTIS